MKLNFPNFPNSINEPFLLTSPKTTHYNCIAWAYEDNSKWYWPDANGFAFWPSEIPREENLNSFIELFKLKNYEICENGQLEIGFIKIAIYCNKEGSPTHAARQLPNGFWTSKLGMFFDVSHTLFSMENGEYGNVAVFMKRIL